MYIVLSFFIIGFKIKLWFPRTKYQMKLKRFQRNTEVEKLKKENNMRRKNFTFIVESCEHKTKNKKGKVSILD